MFKGKDDDPCDGKHFLQPSKNKDLYVQLALSLLLGISAFVGFCVRHAALLVHLWDSACATLARLDILTV